jgi:Ca2+/Na+ antiporter
MAVSNAVGSNVFDILICMGVPWVLKSAINNGEPIKVYSEGQYYVEYIIYF